MEYVALVANSFSSLMLSQTVTWKLNGGRILIVDLIARSGWISSQMAVDASRVISANKLNCLCFELETQERIS